MSETLSHNSFMSPFSWRYGTPEMRAIWSEVHKRRMWRRVWVALATAQQQAGLVSEEQVADLEAHTEHVDIDRALEIESRIRHDLMAEVQTFAEQCAIGGGIIHLGATSADIQDNADAIRLRDSLDLVLAALEMLLRHFATQINRLADQPTMAYTHIQPAEPTTMGYRLSMYAQDLLEDWHALKNVRANVRGKGIKGAVGSRASYDELLSDTDMTVAQLEAIVMQRLDLSAYPITGQTYPRKQDWQVLTALSGLAGSVYRFAFDLRLLQSPVIGEWSEPFGKHQVGSSAMPFKRNPINAEKLDSLARLVKQLSQVAWDNAAHSLLERTLDDSANRREVLPVAFLAVDEMLRVSNRIVKDLHVDENAARRSMDRFGTFAAIERVLMSAVKAGADRQAMHEVLRQHSMSAWQTVADGQPNPLPKLLSNDTQITQYLPVETLHNLLDATTYVGDTPQRARDFAAHIEKTLSE